MEVTLKMVAREGVKFFKKLSKQGWKAKLKMVVRGACSPPSIVRKNDSFLFCDDVAGNLSRSPSNSRRLDVSFSRKHRSQSKARAVCRILACNRHSFGTLCLHRSRKFHPQEDPSVLCAQRCRNFPYQGDSSVLCVQRRSKLRLQGDPSVLRVHSRGNLHLHGDPVVFCESTSRNFLYVLYSFWQRRRDRFSCDSIKEHSEGSSPSHQDQKEIFKDQKTGENGTLLSSSSSSLSSSSLSPVALSAGACSEISNEEFSETKRLVETAMLAAAAGLAYYLSNTLRIENYFGCFFPLPLVISSLRWGVVAGRKTMAATAMLLLVLSGPLKAATYLLMHGFLGLTMGSLWRSKMSWGASVLICTLVRSLGAMGFVFLSSWLIRDNLLNLITINAHASISFMLAAMGLNFVPSMGSIYFIFGVLVLLNCGSFVFILHVLYAVFLKRLGLNSSLIFPGWLKTL